MKLSLTAVKCQYVVSAKIKLKKTKWEREREKKLYVRLSQSTHEYSLTTIVKLAKY